MSHQPDNISAGTQVVSLVEVRGTSDSLVHPRGAVGVVTRTPASPGERHFLVRFPDGFEGSLTRQQFDVLKHFKDRMTGGESAVTGFDLDSLIIHRCKGKFGVLGGASERQGSAANFPPLKSGWRLILIELYCM